MLSKATRMPRLARWHQQVNGQSELMALGRRSAVRSSAASFAGWEATVYGRRTQTVISPSQLPSLRCKSGGRKEIPPTEESLAEIQFFT